jgi:hypothetical protein
MNNFYYNTRTHRPRSTARNLSNLTNTRRGEFLNDLVELRLNSNSFLYLPYIQWASILRNRNATKIQRWYLRQKSKVFLDR